MWKRGKPFTKLAADQASPRMTRDSYFKLAESQGLSTMRDEMISIMGGPSQTDNLLTTRQSIDFPAGTKGAPKKDQNSSKFVSIANFKEGSEM